MYVSAGNTKSQVDSRREKFSMILAASTSFHYISHKNEPEEELEAFTRHKEVFLSLPTAYRKSLFLCTCIATKSI